MCGSRKKNLGGGGGGVKYEGYLSLAVRGGGVPSHIFVISNVI